MKVIPPYILEAGGTSATWKPVHDDLTLSSSEQAFNLNNQLKFWKTNVQIRASLREIRERIITSSFDGDIVFPKLTIVLFSATCGINRKVLYSRAWLQDELDSINRLAAKRRQGTKLQKSAEKLKLENGLLLEQCEKQTVVIAEYFSKMKRLELKVKNLERIILQKTELIDQLGKECASLVMQINSCDNQRFIEPK